MPTIATRSVQYTTDHFLPEAMLAPAEQKRLRAHLEQIDFAAFAANREVLATAMGPMGLADFEKLGVAVAQARGRWVSRALEFARTGQPLSQEQTQQLATAHQAFAELQDAYEALRRMVERGYLSLRQTQDAPPTAG
ncbi:MAG: hypothetical protein R3C52_02355 [Hyphomonadaceae bacterium]